METSYPIVLTSTKEGYTAYIPDFNLTAKGEKQSDAIDAAKKLSICGVSLKKMQESPFQNHFRPTESSQSPDESSHSLEYPLKNGSVRYKKALLSPSGLMSLLKKKTSTYHKFSRKRSRKNARLTIITQRNGTLAIAPLLFQVQQFRF